MSNPSKLLLLATLAMLAAVPAKADQIKFFSGTTGYTSPSFTRSAGTVYFNDHPIDFTVLSWRRRLEAVRQHRRHVHAADLHVASANISAIGPPPAAVWARPYDRSRTLAASGVGPLTGRPATTDQIAAATY